MTDSTFTIIRVHLTLVFLFTFMLCCQGAYSSYRETDPPKPVAEKFHHVTDSSGYPLRQSVLTKEEKRARRKWIPLKVTLIILSVGLIAGLCLVVFAIGYLTALSGFSNIWVLLFIGYNWANLIFALVGLILAIVRIGRRKPKKRK